MKNYTSILVAIDFSTAAATVIRRAVDVAKRNDAELTLIHVVEYMPPPDMAYETSITPDWAIDQDVLVKHAESTLEKFCAKHDLNDVRQSVVVGAPKYEICNYVREHGCDLIVMGAHGLHGIRLLLGSTTNGVLHEMPCDVLAVKAEE
jgi:universal stress protein A